MQHKTLKPTYRKGFCRRALLVKDSSFNSINDKICNIKRQKPPSKECLLLCTFLIKGAFADGLQTVCNPPSPL